jgi:hypothetical protein
MGTRVLLATASLALAGIGNPTQAAEPGSRSSPSPLVNAQRMCDAGVPLACDRLRSEQLSARQEAERSEAPPKVNKKPVRKTPDARPRMWWSDSEE